MPLEHSINLAWRLDEKSGGKKFLSTCVWAWKSFGEGGKKSTS